MENVLAMWKDFIPVLTTLIAAGKGIGIWYLICIAIFPFLQFIFKWSIIYLIVVKILDSVKYIFIDNSNGNDDEESKVDK